MQGLLLSKDYTYTLLDPRDLGDFTGLSTSVVVQTQRIAISVGLELVRWHLEGMFGRVADGVDADHVRTLRVGFPNSLQGIDADSVSGNGGGRRKAHSGK